METKVQPSDVYMAFECDSCGYKEDYCNVFEAVYNGAPMCTQCEHGEMEMLYCSIKKYFKEKENET